MNEDRRREIKSFQVGPFFMILFLLIVGCGDSNKNSSSNTSYAVSGISARGDHTGAILTDNTLRCWVDNGDGQLGAGHSDNANTPVPVISP